MIVQGGDLIASATDGVMEGSGSSGSPISSIIGGDIISMVTGGALEFVGDSTPPSFTGTPTQLDTKLAAKVLKIIDRLGKTVVFVDEPIGQYEPGTGDYNSGDVMEYSKKVIPPYAYETKLIDGDIIQVGDMQTGLPSSGLEFTPSLSMWVKIDNENWRIIRISPVYSGEQVALYMMQLRK